MSKTLGSPEVLANDMSLTLARETRANLNVLSSDGDCGDQVAISVPPAAGGARSGTYAGL